MTNSIIFVDPSVQDYQSLIHNIDRAKIVILNDNFSAIEQITQALAGESDIEAIHILSHGSEGTLFLGNSPLDKTTLETHAHTVKQWGKALKRNADILLYGCNVAQTEQGKDFVKRLSQLTKANVAASTNLTGNAKLGGDWNLEFITGKIKAALAFSPEVTAAYNGVLGNGPGGVEIANSTSNLALWLKANTIPGTPVASWTDNSGYARNATQGNVTFQPTLATSALNGQPTVRFDGTNDTMSVPLDISPSVNPNITIFTVFNSTTATNAPYRKIYGNDDGGFDRTIGLDNRSGTNNFTYFGGSGVNNYFTLAANTYYLSSHTYSTTNFNGWINGTQQVTNGPVNNSNGYTTLSLGSLTGVESIGVGILGNLLSIIAFSMMANATSLITTSALNTTSPSVMINMQAIQPPMATTTGM